MNARPRVFKSQRTGEWIVRYRSHQFDRFPSWQEAFDHAFNWSRVRHMPGVL